MDIVTHAGIGLIAAAPLLNSHPELAVGLLMGSVLPDLDALARVCGKRAFLRAHQTWSHALPIQAVVSGVVGILGQRMGVEGWLLGAGLFAGLAFHTLLDFSNTLGVTLLAPVSRRRFCRECVFFIDAFVLAITMVATGFTLGKFSSQGNVSPACAIAFFGTLVMYVGIKAGLRQRAGRLVPRALSVMPSALWPWRFFAVVDEGDCICLYQLNVLTGQRPCATRQQVYDADYIHLLAPIPEFGLMRALSPAYHVVAATKTEVGERIVCRDLRTRNFGTNFGDLEVWLNPRREVIRITFHV